MRAELRQPAAYFEDLNPPQLDPGQLALARQLIENKTAQFDPAAFTDRYQAALLDLIKAKLNGNAPVQVTLRLPGRSLISWRRLSRASKRPARSSHCRKASRARSKLSGCLGPR